MLFILKYFILNTDLKCWVEEGGRQNQTCPPIKYPRSGPDIKYKLFSATFGLSQLIIQLFYEVDVFKHV